MVEGDFSKIRGGDDSSLLKSEIDDSLAFNDYFLLIFAGTGDLFLKRDPLELGVAFSMVTSS